MTDVTLLDVPAIRTAWNATTSSTPGEWTKANRARGQCAITAVLVQEAIGGTIIRTVATTPNGDESHYANLLDDDVILDLTESQFPEGTEFGPWEERTREYILSYPETARRYDHLLRRINETKTARELIEA